MTLNRVEGYPAVYWRHALSVKTSLNLCTRSSSMGLSHHITKSFYLICLQKLTEVQSLYHYNNKGHTACADYCIQCHVLVITIHVDAHLPAEDGVKRTRKFLYPEGKSFDWHTAV